MFKKPAEIISHGVHPTPLKPSRTSELGGDALGQKHNSHSFTFNCLLGQLAYADRPRWDQKALVKFLAGPKADPICGRQCT